MVVGGGGGGGGGVRRPSARKSPKVWLGYASSEAVTLSIVPSSGLRAVWRTPQEDGKWATG